MSTPMPEVVCPHDLLMQLAYAYGIGDFVRAGTMERGEWCERVFPHVWSLKVGSGLPSVMEKLSGPAIFWLDAGGAGDELAETFTEPPCDVLEQITAIRSDTREHYVFIDHAELLLAPPHRPHRIDHWPTIDRVLDTLRVAWEPYIVVQGGVLMAVPERARNLVARYCQEENTHLWMQRRGVKPSAVASVERSRERLSELVRLARDSKERAAA
ncbi:hypothetical protein [Mucisphaera calidilacus]|uniref:Uncharacterized protein n=1 Tax=Mucisphaera calidilacus TaxID=2527982 RepID=A0A518BZ17_9BACT|nr:hypothetical protein [Mucisphaera calidilacus]QDU72222.1 hypothetical protein Pan265_20860 [Mucisphaera calidilacus]